MLVSNMLNWAKKEGILVGPGRGSAAGSLVCYALGITDVDPLELPAPEGDEDEGRQDSDTLDTAD